MTNARFSILVLNRSHLNIKKGKFPNFNAAIRTAERILKGIPNAYVMFHSTTVVEGLVGCYIQQF